MDEVDGRELELEGRQGPVYPIGLALRATYDAENHDSLGQDLTGLMLELARVEPPAPPPPPRSAAAPASSWFGRFLQRLRAPETAR